MSNNNVALHADVANIPSSSLSTLGSFRPLLKALSADDVSPMAVLQVEAIGACFHFNGKFANRVPDLLVRSNSVRLDRLSQWVGWIRGDTASMMVGTAGGRAGAMIVTVLMENFAEPRTAEILYDLSSKLLNADQNGSSMSQLGRVAATLSNKLGAIGYGSHLADQATRIRQAYLFSERRIPLGLVDLLAETTMVDLLLLIHRALTEETSILYVEGCYGIARIIAILTALCPDDVFVLVENEIIFRGVRRSIIVSVKANQIVKFGIETVLVNKRSKSLNHIIETLPSYLKATCNLRMKWNGFLVAYLDLGLLEQGVAATPELREICADFISSIVFSTSPEDLSGDSSNQPALPDGLKGLLGPFPRNRVRQCLSRIFLTEPTFTSMNNIENYIRLRNLVRKLVPKAACECENSCFDLQWWGMLANLRCPVRKVWDIIEDILQLGIAALFVTADESATVSLSPLGTSYSPLDAVMSSIMKQMKIVGESPIRPSNKPYQPHSLHKSIMLLEDNVRNADRYHIGVSSGSSSIFPSALLDPSLASPMYLEYRLEDGQFHDGRTYYERLIDFIDDASKPRPPADKCLTKSGAVVSSSLGVHSDLIITARSSHKDFRIRTVVQISGKDIGISFINTLLASMSVKVAEDCVHPRGSLKKAIRRKVITTSVAAPTSKDERVAITLTHGNPEAQFLCCIRDVSTLFQGSACLNCAVEKAERGSFSTVIQS